MKDITKKENEQREQCKFLVKLVPYLYKFNCFVFHGGTVLNLYTTDKFKRYSIDLDGVFVPDKKNLSIEEAHQIISSRLKELREELMSPENKEALGIRKIYRNLKPPSLNIIIEHPFKKGIY